MTYEILSRGKRIDNGEWVKGDLISSQCNTNKNHCYILPAISIVRYDGKHIEIGGFVRVSMDTIGRYTGLTDKNGVKIFEGDIVKTKYGRLCIIVWFQPQLCWDMEPVCTKENLNKKAPDRFDLWYSENLEVTSNIHDNKLEDFHD